MKKHIIFLTLILVFSLVVEMQSQQSLSNEQQVQTHMYKIYEWWNGVVDPKNHFDPLELDEIVTRNFVWRSSEVTWAHDYSSLCELVDELRGGSFLLIIDLPFKEVIVSEDLRRCVLRYTVQKNYYNGIHRREHVIAIWEIAADGKLCRLHEVAHQFA